MSATYHIKRITTSGPFVSGLLTLAVLAAVYVNFYPLEFLENQAYDVMAVLRPKNPDNTVVVVAVDDASVSRVGSWPWPRARVAELIRRLTSYRPHTQGIRFLFAERQDDLWLEQVDEMRKTFGEDSDLKSGHTLGRIDSVLSIFERVMDQDARLLSAVRSADQVVLPLLFRFQPGPTVDQELGGWLQQNALDLRSHPKDLRQRPLSLVNLEALQRGYLDPPQSILAPYSELSKKAGTLGHINQIPDRDGVVRKVPLFIRYNGRDYPSFSLQTGLKIWGLDPKSMVPDYSGPGFRGVQSRALQIPTDQFYRMNVDFAGHSRAIQTIPAVDVLDGKVDSGKIRAKIVIVGVTAGESAPIYRTPTGEYLSGVQIDAAAVANIVTGNHIARPSWAMTLEMAIIIYFGLFLMFAVPRLSPRMAVVILAAFLFSWTALCVFLFEIVGAWVKPMTPIVLVGFGFALSMVARLSTRIRRETLALNKTLGLAYQGQGMLDMAFERFMQCPVGDKSVKELLYNLGLDFERKRMFNKASAVYDYLLKSGRFRDIKNRIERLKSLDEALIFGGTGRQEDTLVVDFATAKPTLGRYEVLRMLGRGAMGSVYLGRDPKINREVAIKTMPYAALDREKLKDVRDRFFREAEAAGKLSHPNIITVFDVGEDHDMAFMAMEVLTGDDLSKHCRPGKLLPPATVFSILSAVAEALDYAHREGVVHRDIKPSNIMLLPNDQVKVMDFGIARVMSSDTDTRTGVVVGTPHYMSPEQVEGQKVDGRSDLFSLGVLLYEMLTGEKPFRGNTITNVMYAISAGQYTPPSELVPGLPVCCDHILSKLLARDPMERYQTAAMAVQDFRSCLNDIQKQETKNNAFDDSANPE